MGWQDAPAVTPAAPPAAGEPAWKKAPAVAMDFLDRATGAASRVGGEVVGAGEAALNTVTGLPASLGGGLTYLATLAGSGDPEAAKAVQENTQRALTYAPRSEYGKEDVQAVGNVMNALVEAPTQYLGEKATDVATYAGARPEVAGGIGATVKTGLQAIPYVVGAKPLVKRGVEAVKERTGFGEKPAPAAGPSAGETKAREYVARNTVLDFDAIPAALREQLAKMAEQGMDLSKLDPKQLERIARAGAQRVPVPLLRSNVTRDLGDITREENVTRAPKSGIPVREKLRAQDKALHQNLDALADAYAPGSRIKSSVDAGPPIQLAGRRKLQWLKADYRRAYEKADRAGETAQPADASALQEWVAADPGRGANVGWVLDRLRQYSEKNQADGGPPRVTVKNLEALHGELSAEAEAGGRKGFAAGQAAQVVDRMLNEQGGSLYKEARRKFARTQEETKNQTIVRDLVGEKAGTSDRRIALERTTDYVIQSSAESLAKLKKTLIEGGSQGTRAAGERAWNDLRRGVILKLREKAAGKRQVPNEAGDLQFNSEVLDMFGELDRSGKLEMLYGKPGAAELRSLADTIRDVRTKPSDRIAGPNTTPRLLAALEFFASNKIPGLKGFSEAYVERAEAKRAATNPTEEAAAAASKAGKKAEVRRTYRERARAAAPAATRQQEQEQ